MECPTCEGYGKLIATLTGWQKDYFTYGQTQEKSKPIDCSKCGGSGEI